MRREFLLDEQKVLHTQTQFLDSINRLAETGARIRGWVMETPFPADFERAIDAAFGDQGPEAAAAAANEAIERLDAWSVSECGDFCELWPRLNWALEVGRRFNEAEARGAAGPWLKLQHRLATALVFKKIHAATGGNIRFYVSTGAPLVTQAMGRTLPTTLRVA